MLLLLLESVSPLNEQSMHIDFIGKISFLFLCFLVCVDNIIEKKLVVVVFFFFGYVSQSHHYSLQFESVKFEISVFYSLLVIVCFYFLLLNIRILGISALWWAWSMSEKSWMLYSFERSAELVLQKWSIRGLRLSPPSKHQM